MSDIVYVLRYTSGPYVGEHHFASKEEARQSAQLSGFEQWQTAAVIDGELVEIVDGHDR